MALLIKEGENLVTYYILPLLGINKSSFGRTFKTSYINKEGTSIYIELTKNMVSPSYSSNPYYRTQLVIEGKNLLLFDVPKEFLEDAHNFIDGTYSCFSSKAKKLIYKTSTLPYNKTMSSFKMTHPILHALDSSKVLRKFLKAHFEVEEVADSGELIDKPSEDWFIESLIK